MPKVEFYKLQQSHKLWYLWNMMKTNTLQAEYQVSIISPTEMWQLTDEPLH